MAKVTSHTAQEKYAVEITSLSGNALISDEPTDKGGQNKGLSPTELVAAALAACTSVTLRMYANRKGWDLTDVFTEIELITDPDTGKSTISRKIHVSGNLVETQRARLLAIANKCPVHKILSGQVEIETQMV